MRGLVSSVLLGGLLLSNTAWAEPPQQCVPLGKWFDITDQKPLSHRETIKQLALQEIVLLGEDHDNVQHHRWQLHTIAKLHALQPDMAIGFESFPRRLQPVLDRWINNELTEKEFLKEVEWENIWNYDIKYYMPMFQFARMHNIHIYAMNVERTLIKKVGQEGWANVPKEEREGVGDPAPASKDYIDSLAGIFSQHMPHGSNGEQPAFDTNEPGFVRFTQSQQVWDRAMAEIAHQAVRKDKHKLFVGVMGAGHIMQGFGIPHQLNDMGKHRVRSLLPWDGAIGCENLEPGLSDLAFGMTPPDKEEKKKKHRPMLGIYLEASEKGVNITKLVPSSLAEGMGMKKGDIITQVAGSPVERVSDVVNVVKNMQRGTWLPITVKRGDKTIEMVAKFPPKKHNEDD